MTYIATLDSVRDLTLTDPLEVSQYFNQLAMVCIARAMATADSGRPKRAKYYRRLADQHRDLANSPTECERIAARVRDSQAASPHPGILKWSADL